MLSINNYILLKELKYYIKTNKNYELINYNYLIDVCIDSAKYFDFIEDYNIFKLIDEYTNNINLKKNNFIDKINYIYKNIENFKVFINDKSLNFNNCIELLNKILNNFNIYELSINMNNNYNIIDLIKKIDNKIDIIKEKYNIKNNITLFLNIDDFFINDNKHFYNILDYKTNNDILIFPFYNVYIEDYEFNINDDFNNDNIDNLINNLNNYNNYKKNIKNNYYYKTEINQKLSIDERKFIQHDLDYNLLLDDIIINYNKIINYNIKNQIKDNDIKKNIFERFDNFININTFNNLLSNEENKKKLLNVKFINIDFKENKVNTPKYNYDPTKKRYFKFDINKQCDIIIEYNFEYNIDIEFNKFTTINKIEYTKTLEKIFRSYYHGNLLNKIDLNFNIINIINGQFDK